jgi:hypothetical protein
MGRLCDYRNADNVQQLQRGLKTYVRSLAPLEFSDEPYANLPTLRKVGTTKTQVPAGIFEQHADSSREHCRTLRLVN